jgi:hypothetical protein
MNLLLCLPVLTMLFLEPFVMTQGRVLDSNGAAISDARVTYRRDMSGSFGANMAEDHGICEGTLLTDRSGQFTAKVHPGLYDVCAMRDAFTPQCVKHEVKATGRMSFPTFHLKSDPLVTKKIGDTFR